MDTDGKFLASTSTYRGARAYHTSHGAFIATVNFARCLPCITHPGGGSGASNAFHQHGADRAYRGAGRPEANYCLERLVDEAARITSIDRIAIRRRNLISPAACLQDCGRNTYDSGISRPCSTKALASADVPGFAARQATSKAATARPRRLVSSSRRGGSRARAPPSPSGSSKLLLADRRAGRAGGARTVYRRLVATTRHPAELIRGCAGRQ